MKIGAGQHASNTPRRRSTIRSIRRTGFPTSIRRCRRSWRMAARNRPGALARSAICLGRRPSGIRKPCRPAGGLHPSARWTMFKTGKRANAARRRHDRHGAGVFRRRDQCRRRVLFQAEADRRLQQGGRNRHRAEKLCRRRRHAVRRAGRRAPNRSATASSMLPKDETEAKLRDPHSGFTDYVPAGSVAKGQALGSRRRRQDRCRARSATGRTCDGMGEVPGITGRTATYIFRQLNDIQSRRAQRCRRRLHEAGCRQPDAERHDRACGLSGDHAIRNDGFHQSRRSRSGATAICRRSRSSISAARGPARIHLRAARRHGERRRPRAGRARLAARRPRRAPCRQPRRIYRRLLRHHARRLRRGAGQFQIPARDHRFHHPRCRREVRVLRRAARAGLSARHRRA